MHLDQAKVLFDKIQERRRELYTAGFDDEWGTFRTRPPVPWNEEEVRDLERRLGLPLPAAYREFLLWMGGGGSGFMTGSDFYIGKWEHVEEMREAAEALLEGTVLEGKLPEDAFVFFFHQGYQFMFFRLSEGDDPPVYYYNEALDHTEFVHRSAHFSEWLMKELEKFAQHIERVADFETQRTGHKKS